MVSKLAITFQNITSTFSPRWSDHPLDYIFSKKNREDIRFELTARGSIPTTFHAHLVAAISVGQNQAAAALSRSQPSSQPPPRLPPSYTLDSFVQELEDFFGGSNTRQSRERSLDVLRETGSVSELAIAFQNITSTFIPRSSDHLLIYVFSKKLREVIRFELTAQGSLPTTLQAYVAAAIFVEQN